MAQFSVNSNRFTPYKAFKFRILWDGEVVAGVSKVTGLKKMVEVVTHREGGDVSTSRKMPGLVNFEPITCERGVTHDKAFENWANKVWNYTDVTGSETSLKDFRKSIRLEIFNEAGQLAIAYNIYRCWVSEFQAAGDLDANASGVLIQSLKIEHEGFERDDAVTEPTEPSFGNIAAL